MNEFRAKIGSDGRILIPVYCRRLLHLKPGQELILQVEDEEMRLFSLQHSLKKAQALVQKHTKKPSFVKQLKQMRRKACYLDWTNGMLLTFCFGCD